jgi:dihydropteroate synthase
MPFSQRPRHTWRLRTREFVLGERTLLMGILNVTPDSFSDGGLFHAHEAAVAQGIALLDEGADLLDVGGESTRPNAQPISAEEEQGRVLPVIASILKHRPKAILSIDTYHAETAKAALGLGVEIVNDVSGLLWDAKMAQVVAEAHCGLVLMHTRGRPREWATQAALPLDRVVRHVLDHLQGRIAAARAVGIEPARIVLDPGFGFGIRGAENDALLAGLDRLHALGLPLLTGTSRKGFLRAAPANPTPAALAIATEAAHVAAILAGTHILRAHDIPAARATGTMADAVLAQTEMLS